MISLIFFLDFLSLIALTDTIKDMLSFFLLPITLFAASLSVSTSSSNICAINGENGRVLYSKNMHQKIFPGSVTKLAVALYLIEECNIDKDLIITCNQEVLKVVSEKEKIASKFTLPPYLLENDGVTLYLSPGERITMESLLYALIVKSANDAANVLASLYFDSIPDFMFKLNSYLRGIGCKNTHFLNPHGLHHPDHVTSPYDLALILQRAISYPMLRKLISTAEYEIPKTNRSPSRIIKNSNGLIRPNSKHYLPYVIGGKTGYHREAKCNIASVGEKDGRLVIVVVNKAENRLKLYEDCRKIFTAAFEEKKQSRVLFNKKDSSFSFVLPWAAKNLVAKLHEDCILEFYPSEEGEVVAEVNWHEFDRPISADALVATLDVYNDEGDPIAQYELFSDESIGYKLSYQVRLAINAFIKLTASHPFLTFIGIVIIFLCIPKRRRKVV